MRRGFAGLATLGASAAASLAHAEVLGEAEDPSAVLQRAYAAADPARFVPGAIAADAGTPIGTGALWGGYDGATRVPLTGAVAEVRLGSRVAIGAGATYAARDNQEPAALRPSAMVRVQLLDQSRHGMDLAVTAAYRQDRFVTEDGLLQATASLGLRSERSGVLVDVGYGQDGEGDDHVGEARIVAFHQLAGTLQVGLDGHVQGLLESSDPNRALHDTPEFELTVAPAVSYRLGPVTLLVEVGWSGVDRDAFHSGAFAISGLGTAF